MQEWKIKQKLYHKLNKDYEDDLTDADIEITKDIISNPSNETENPKTEDNLSGEDIQGKFVKVLFIYLYFVGLEFGNQTTSGRV